MTKPENKEIFSNYTKTFIIMVEGIRDKAYRDTKGKTTIGVGFNMDRDEALMEWNEIFGRAVSFDEVYKGDCKLTKEEIYKSIDHFLRCGGGATITLTDSNYL